MSDGLVMADWAYYLIATPRCLMIKGILDGDSEGSLIPNNY